MASPECASFQHDDISSGQDVFPPPTVLHTDFNLEHALEQANAEDMAREDEEAGDCDCATPDDPPSSPLPPLTPSPELPTMPLPAFPFPPTPGSIEDAPHPPLAAHLPHLPPSSMNPTDGPSDGKTGKQRYKRRHRCELRQNKRARMDALNYAPSKHIADAHGEPPTVQTSASARKFTRADGAWVGKHMAKDVDGKSRAVEDMEAAGFQYIDWDPSAPLLLTDCNEQVVAIFAGFPVGDPNWVRCVKGVQVATDTLGEQLEFDGNERLPKPSHGHGYNRRGDYQTVDVGFSFGGGQTVPGNLQHTPQNEKALKTFIENPNVERSVKFANSVLAQFAPNVYEYYRTTVCALCKQHPHLRRNFKGSVYAGMTVNVGPRVVCRKHKDSNNLADGLCWIMANGDFDPNTGGQLILWELKVIVKFPPGASVFIPSAVISHENLPIAEGETRTSITQYFSGGLFRWVEYGFRTWKNFEKAEKARAAEVWGERPTRWRRTVHMFSKYQDLRKDRERVFSL